MELRLRATGRHYSHVDRGITKCYINRHDNILRRFETEVFTEVASFATRHKWRHPALIPASRPVLDVHTLEGWKAELT